MNRLLTFAFAACVALSAAAIPARQGVRTFTQPDGSQIQLRLIGDEFSHNYVNADGKLMHRDADGFFREMTPAQAAERHAAGIKRRSVRNLPVRRAAQENQSQVPHIGSPSIPILLVQYSDYKFKDKDPAATFDKFFAEGNSSAHQYFLDQSNGKFDGRFDIYGPVTLSGKRADYGGNDYWGEDKGVGKMVGEACLGLDGKIDFSKYDNDGDGECDVVIVLYAGDGEASSYDEDCEDSVWPCQWSLEDSDYGKSIRLDNTKVNLFAVFNELYGENLSEIDGIGTFCHEFSHCLGLPDFYDTQYGPHFGMGSWSLMDQGSYNDDGYTPIGYSAYEKEFMGWIEIPEANENTLYTLTPMNLKSEATDMAVKLTNAADPDEYYILENRKKQGWDAYMAAEGLLITHFTYDADAWNGNTVNDYDLQRATLIPADNSLKLDRESYWGQTYYYINEADLKGDLWPYRTANELTDTSTPSAKVNKGGYMSKPITEITKNSDGTISFYAMKGALPAVETPDNLTHTLISESSALISWECNDVNAGSYTLEVTQHVDNPYTLLHDVIFNSDNHGWTPGGYYEYDNIENCAKLGSGKNVGSLTSPILKTEDGHEKVTVVFSAKTYGSDKTTVKVSITNPSGTRLKTLDFPLTSAVEDYKAVFDLPGGTSFKVMIETTVNKNRFYLYTAKISSGEKEEFNAPQKRVATEAPRIFEGIKEKSYQVDGLTPKSSYDYRVHAVAADPESFANSAWTPKMVLDLSEITGVEVLPIDADAPERWITLQGVQLSGRPSAPGVYIHIIGGKTHKVIL